MFPHRVATERECRRESILLGASPGLSDAPRHVPTGRQSSVGPSPAGTGIAGKEIGRVAAKAIAQYKCHHPGRGEGGATG